jgi:uncharacterized repeat protein (TIGR01451 family)
MRKLSVTSLLLSTAVTFAVTGCAIPGGNQSNLRQPVAQAKRQPTVASVPAASNPSPVAQVGYLTPTAQPRGPAHIPCGPALVGSQPLAGLVGGACNCNGCGSTGCAPEGPHGYIVPTPFDWNAYGIDPQEFLCDGGDQAPQAIVRRDDSIGGVQPEDTVVHYTTEAGDIEIQASNRTCVYAPRFSSVRKITGALAGGRAVGLKQVDRPWGTDLVDVNLPGLTVTESTKLAHADVARRIDAMRERNRGVPVESVLQPIQAADIMAVLANISNLEMGELRDNEQAEFEKLALAAVTWSLDEALEVAIEDMKTPTLTRDQQIRGFTIYEFPDAGRLQICKLADRDHALPGEVVNFAIRVVNVGDSPVENIVLTDNLTTRLEYVADSQSCTGGAEFEANSNEARSLKLQWKLTDKLRVGESVTVRFQCKVR